MCRIPNAGAAMPLCDWVSGTPGGGGAAREELSIYIYAAVRDFCSLTRELVLERTKSRASGAMSIRGTEIRLYERV